MKVNRLLSGWIILTLLLTSVGCATNDRRDESLERPGYRTTRVGNDVRNYVRDDDVRNRTIANRGNDTRNNYPSYRIVRDNARYNTSNNMMAQNFRVADDVADSITDLNRVKSSAVAILGRNAYVAVVLKGNDKLTDQMKKNIANRARATDPAIRNVYVSANPEFVKQMNQYVQDLRNGRPVSGIINNMVDIIKRTFPEAK
ncbi:YhcN/YlaJ family sporulation lipoprotein [Paenactinomyces guangxiensis]|uniref:YhcN/YlaJ family sporulation lipoprotein n=1 Tax=Paenactinomyces guangxiensis TaxID=1490290 RepID=A0A7W1WNL1_9BACL|nr:YhcN/YlaJ family sporulation lipoprotein [Paenactinomyces guangxiensis]MBA4493208.1 YhcN/YlaJ family sporulation lipoprotein [Paenactinomyces guangxiensis]MBH8589942.1 YhcN/YlaJ family sporulation lipoprotein [Paenactinomyces guangxiensis]